MSRKTALYTHENCLLHYAGDNHPESPQRLKNVLKAMRAAFANEDDTTCWIQAPQATKAQVLLAHDVSYWDMLTTKATSLREGDAPVHVDEDTRISHGSLTAALHGVGAACQAVDDVYSQKYRNGFCLTRPPGHHALKKSSMGFCLFGNVAIAAKHALTKDGINKVAIIDFDVHQGNGTENLVEDDPNIVFFSIHEQGSWPYEHHEDDSPHGTIHNIAVPIKSDASVYHQIFDEKIIPTLEAWQPDFIFISAGFDAHRDDPPAEDTLLNDPPGRQMLLEKDFNTMTRKLMVVAQRYAQGRLVSVMEGGYNTDVLSRCCVAHGKTLALEC